ncbi:hypothetical protein FDP41_008084 [Naegleria fowleri]|uniref:Peptidase S8/S53 domain-containing protein n=1 Tax=Naegleria fowleri TaxID=5763 RepID=A0A6A5B8A1_NAEFO|nr:uncharacterized protein FDP41_008084 [Naegleria fowleri]KAF0973657.1 hypothetical protein FDP41_008084 [Naegleria fowleri]
MRTLLTPTVRKRRKQVNAFTQLLTLCFIFLLLHSNIVFSEKSHHDRFSHPLDGRNLLLVMKNSGTTRSSEMTYDSFMNPFDKTLSSMAWVNNHLRSNQVSRILVNLFIRPSTQVLLTKNNLRALRTEVFSNSPISQGDDEQLLQVVAGSNNRIFTSWLSYQELEELSKKTTSPIEICGTCGESAKCSANQFSLLFLRESQIFHIEWTWQSPLLAKIVLPRVHHHHYQSPAFTFMNQVKMKFSNRIQNLLRERFIESTLSFRNTLEGQSSSPFIINMERMIQELSDSLRLSIQPIQTEHDESNIEEKNILRRSFRISLENSLPNQDWIKPFLPSTSEFSILKNNPEKFLSEFRLSDTRYLWNQGVTGKDQIVHLIDSGLDVNHCFFSKKGGVEDYYTVPNVNNRKVVYYEKAKLGDRMDKNGHGSHTCGIIAGNPESSATSSDSPILQDIGIAKDAKLYMTDAAVSVLFYVDNITLYLSNAYKVGARISSNSWGNANPLDCVFDCQCFESNSNRTKPVTNEFCLKQYGKLCCQVGNEYDVNAERVDDFLFKNDEMIIIFAAGNNGHYGRDGSDVSNRKFPKVSRTESVFSTCGSQNSLAVGASYSTLREYSRKDPNVNATLFNHENLGYFSSRGPTFDNRIKPEIVSPGVAIWSARVNNPFCDASALIQKRLLQYELINKSSSQTLSGTLVKAILIHSASTMKGSVKLDGDFTQDRNYVNLSQESYPNKYVGYGRVDLGNLLRFGDAGNSFFLVNRFELDASQKVLFKFRIKSLLTQSMLLNTGIKATLTWYDRKGTQTSSSQPILKQLINDLNLSLEVIENTSGNVTLRCVGNGKCVNTLDSNGDLAYDSFNNIERIDLERFSNIPPIDLSRSLLTFTIEASSQNVGSQNFSLVVSSQEEIELEFWNTLWWCRVVVVHHLPSNTFLSPSSSSLLLFSSPTPAFKISICVQQLSL